VLLVYLFWSVDLAELGRQLRATRWGWAALATAFAPLGLWARARRWRYLFPPGSVPPGLVPAVMIGYMANNVLPLRAGEVVRVYVVARRWSAVGAGGTGHAFWTVLATLIVHRGLDGIRAPSHALPILVWTAILWVIPAAAASMMLTAMNLSLPWIAGWAVLAFVGLGISIPSAPGYVGVFHAAAALAVGLFGVA